MKLLIIIALALITLYSCKKEDPKPSPTRAEIQAMAKAHKLS